jgi:hypothetical protein
MDSTPTQRGRLPPESVQTLIASLRAQVAELAAQHSALTARLTELEARVDGLSSARPARQRRAPRVLQWDARRFGHLLALAAALHLAAFAFVAAFFPISQDYTDIFTFLAYGQKMQAGLVPYRDFVVEYPPLATPLFWLPVKFSHDWDSYARAFTVEVLCFDLVGAGIALWALRRLAPHVPPWGVMLAQPLWLIAVGRGLVFARFDMVPAVLVLLAIALFALSNQRWAWGVLGLATVVKLYPVVIVPLFLLAAWGRRPRRQLMADVGAFVAAVLLPAVIVARGALQAMSSMFTYHLDRGVEIETIYASLLLIAHIAGDTARYTYGHGSVDLAAPLAPYFASLALPLTILTLGLIYALAWRDRRGWQDVADGTMIFDRLTRLSALAILAFMLAGKVLSPQYLLWLYPLAAVFLDRRATRWWALYAVALALTHWIFPVHWDDLVALKLTPVIVLVVRNGILLILGAMLLSGFHTQPSLETGRSPALTRGLDQP